MSAGYRKGGDWSRAAAVIALLAGCGTVHVGSPDPADANGDAAEGGGGAREGGGALLDSAHDLEGSAASGGSAGTGGFAGSGGSAGTGGSAGSGDKIDAGDSGTVDTGVGDTGVDAQDARIGARDASVDVSATEPVWDSPTAIWDQAIWK